MTAHTLLIPPATAVALQWILAILIIDYASVTAAALIDLRSALRKCRREGIRRTSRGYRRTVDKLGRYYTTLMALTVIDAMLAVSAIMLRATAGWSLPAFPLFTTLGAVAITLIEVKSVIENTQRRDDFTSTARAITDMLDTPQFRELADRLRDLLASLRNNK